MKIYVRLLLLLSLLLLLLLVVVVFRTLSSHFIFRHLKYGSWQYCNFQRKKTKEKKQIFSEEIKQNKNIGKNCIA